jgi:OOP family OmpA-OmpF porin
VNDAADRCPNTTAGTPVDANGCARDADGDGVADNMDRCANTPRGTPVDANGCPRDADNDGVNDTADRCPGTAAGTPVDANGCPRDSDNDGVNDAADRCPSTPAGARVDANGCPLAPDADRDGVEDARDRCPNTPTTGNNRMVDANGCYLAELPAVGASLVVRNINFSSGASRLLASSNRSLDDMAASIQAILRQSPNARFEVGGYTDNRGVAATNRRLSQARAQAVVTYLTGKGIPASALTAVGYGPDNPKAPNTTAAGRAQNRRVEIKRLS